MFFFIFEIFDLRIFRKNDAKLLLFSDIRKFFSLFFHFIT